MRTTCTAHFK